FRWCAGLERCGDALQHRAGRVDETGHRVLELLPCPMGPSGRFESFHADFAWLALLLHAALGRSPRLFSMKPAISATLCPARRLLNTNGRVPRMRRASRSMTSREAPTCGARSILLMTRRSERVMPGPPFEGIFSPPATSIT